ncbi:MAG: efflux RND transporter permease subunit [Armatimonadetes bacterium]|nr:efflux RND transporter permease subunit [Armatimonadota bacterium]
MAIARPVFILMLMLAAILMGSIGYKSMRVELNPDVSFGVVTITTVYPGAGPDEVNTLISKKVEEAISGIANLREVNSSSQEGVSAVVLNFEIGSDIDVALNEVRTKVDQLIPSLPDGAERPLIDKLDTSQDPVLTLILKSDSLSNRQLRDLADNQLKDRFARVKGVAAVDVSGGEEREIQVRLRKDDLLRFGVGIVDVQRAIQAATINVPAGRLQSGGQEYTVRVLGEAKSVEDVENTYLTLRDPNRPGPGKTIQIKDIADVVDANAERRSYSRLDGLDSVIVTIQKAKAGNAVEISKAINVPLPPIAPGAPAPPSMLKGMEQEYGITFTTSFDASKEIKESLEDLNVALIFGIILVSAVIWMFLHNFRGTLIVAIAIPVCLFTTLIAYWVFGFTINNLSMLALSLAIGVLVDDAIVVIENIYRHLTMGEEPEEAAINGRMEIGLAAIAITLADVVVFLPIGFMGGIVGQFFRPLGIGYATAVLISLFVSFTVTPMLASRWYRKGEDWEHPKGRFAQGFEKSFNWFADRYRGVLQFSLKHRWYFFGGGFAALVGVFLFTAGTFAPDVPAAIKTGMGMARPVVAIAILAFIGGLIFQRKLKFGIFLGMLAFIGFFIAMPVLGKAYQQWKGEAVFKFAFAPPTDNGVVNINVELPAGSDITETEKVVKFLEQKAMAHPMAEYVVSDIGRRAGGFGASFRGTNFAQISVTLYEKEALLDKILFKKHEGKQRPMSVTAETVAADLIQSIKRVPGATVNVVTGDSFSFGSDIQLSFTSNDRDLLVKTAKTLRDRLANGEIEGVINPDITTKEGKPELRAVPDRARLAAASMTVADLGLALRTMYEGDNQAKLRDLGEEYDVRVMLDLEDRNNPQLLGSVPVAFKEGNPIYLNEVASIQQASGLDKIDRRDRQEVVNVTADLLPGFAVGSVQGEIDKWMKDEGLVPAGVNYKPLGQADAQAREMVYLQGALFIGIILVYMVLASLYNNVLYPLIIQLTQPQAMAGALLALFITDKTLNIVGFIGIIALMGLVGKNAILLVDYANTLRERGYERTEALVESGGTRMRPIMMTTFSLILGMLPVALAIGRGSEFRETIGITIIGGTIFSTFLTLLVIPCSYTVFDDISAAIGNLMRRFRDAP